MTTDIHPTGSDNNSNKQDFVASSTSLMERLPPVAQVGQPAKTSGVVMLGMLSSAAKYAQEHANFKTAANLGVALLLILSGAGAAFAETPNSQNSDAGNAFGDASTDVTNAQEPTNSHDANLEPGHKTQNQMLWDFMYDMKTSDFNTDNSLGVSIMVGEGREPSLAAIRDVGKFMQFQNNDLETLVDSVSLKDRPDSYFFPFGQKIILCNNASYMALMGYSERYNEGAAIIAQDRAAGDTSKMTNDIINGMDANEVQARLDAQKMPPFYYIASSNENVTKISGMDLTDALEEAEKASASPLTLPLGALKHANGMKIILTPAGDYLEQLSDEEQSAVLEAQDDGHYIFLETKEDLAPQQQYLETMKTFMVAGVNAYEKPKLYLAPGLELDITPPEEYGEPMYQLSLKIGQDGKAQGSIEKIGGEATEQNYVAQETPSETPVEIETPEIEQPSKKSSKGFWETVQEIVDVLPGKSQPDEPERKSLGQALGELAKLIPGRG
jgi:hypothetical protein